ncbi:hypothetical protein [Flagellimonas halotolerans]|uniref:Uncharacterized protein n=1 Tax=Flagellimonas halotolerans TaxID=3112164 RepID=A0ABU6IPZ4_9FLAO|nr:hypothetical protein [Muricauda sp. SYSU M86414]MEC3965282.1 hypothetical protein [Muricauda sp. SYSU M86414]MEC4265148.1 hypothetical protein [Muricauda sp. SYSU M84420]
MKSYDQNLGQSSHKSVTTTLLCCYKNGSFFDRGIKDIYASHDLEDIAYLFNYTSTIDGQLLASEKEVKQFLVKKLSTFKNDKTILTAIRGSLYYEQADERMEIIQKGIQNIANDSQWLLLIRSRFYAA